MRTEAKVDPQDVLTKMNFASPAKLRKKIQELDKRLGDQGAALLGVKS